MRKDRSKQRTLAGGVVLLALALSAVQVRAEEVKPAESPAAASVRRYARETLLQRARDTVDPSNRDAGGLDALVLSLAQERERIADLDKGTWAELEILLGPITMDGGARDGLIRQGATFYRWMNGDGPEVPALTFGDTTNRGVEVQVPSRTPGTFKTEMVTSFPAVLEEIPEAVRDTVLVKWTLRVDRDTRWPAQVLVLGIDDLRTVTPPLADLALTRADELTLRYCRRYVELRQRQVGPRVKASQADIPAAGLVSAGSVRTREDTAKKRRAAVELAASMQAGVELALDRLAEEERKLRRQSGTLGFELEEARREVEQIQKAREAEAARVQAEAEAEQAAAAAKAAADAAAAEAGTAGEGTEPVPNGSDPVAPPPGKDPGEADPGETPAPHADEEDVAAAALSLAAMDQAEVHLETLRLREILGAQKLRLLYISVRRAELRSQLLAEYLRQVKEEAVAAEAALARYEVELATMRRERQMDRLAFAQARLVVEHESAQNQAAEGAEGARPVWAAYDQALKSLMTVNEATIAGVEMRGMLEVRTKPVDRLGIENAALCLTDEQLKEAEQSDPLKRFRDCRAAALDASYVKDALGVLDNPEWDAQLTAVHYEAVDDRILDLESARKIFGQAKTLQERFDTAQQAALTALGQVEKLGARTSDWYAWRERLQEARGEWLLPNEKDFSRTMQGIADEFEKVQSDLAVYRTFRSRLLNLGTRSFRVRLQRKLDTERIGTAYDEATSSLRDAGQWLSFQGDQHLGTYILKNWQLMLACLGVLLASFLFVKYGRRGLDKALHGMARSVEALQTEPVTVGGEEAKAKLDSALSEAAAKAAEEAALREVSKEEAGKSQRTGEGGFSEGNGA